MDSVNFELAMAPLPKQPYIGQHPDQTECGARRSLKDVSKSDFTLAIDVGNSRVTAAVGHHAGGARENPVLFSLSGGESSASSAVFIDDDALYFGETAEDMGAAAPERLIRE
ncbi:MAG: hypothetical protein V4703_06830, partial [Actinomycetota bacterium]